MKPRRFKLYEVDEAEEVLSTVTSAMRALGTYPSQSFKLRTRLAVLRLIHGAEVGRRFDRDGEEYRSLARAKRYLRAIRRRAVRRLREAGVARVSVRRGRAHFYAMRGTEVVLLCWRMGQEDVTVWHRADEPCHLRRPLRAGER